ncbi:MAG: ATP-binding protein [Saprospiraceae bacterium]
MVKNKETHPGYRLQYSEILNWGTFDKKIWRLEPKGDNSLLTGANGSGKTTLVDAIITLLVPPVKRHYNQSSGAKSKRERSEKTYTRGAYVTVQSESGLAAKTKYLRTKDDYSILLGVFYNAVTREYLTLAQVRWFSNNDLKKAYFIAPTALSVQKDFTPMDTGGVWKRRLKKSTKAEEFDSFTKYQQTFSRKFGLKSEKALSLFAQTVGIKVLGNLNEFIRTNMLEEHDAETEFVELREHYDNLLSAHQSIEKAREQMRLLQPIVETGELFQNLEREVRGLEKLQNSIAPYFAEQRRDLLTDAMQSLQADVAKKANQMQALRQELEGFSDQRTDLQIAIRNNEMHEQIQNLDKQISDTQRERDRRKTTAHRYNLTADKLDLKANPNEKAFYRTLEKSQKQIGDLQQQREELRAAEVDLQIQLDKKRAAHNELETQLQSLLQRKNRIPVEQIRIRESLMKKLDLSEKQLPFAAELLKIKKGEENWELPVEEVLRPLALSILIPVEHEETAMQYVNQTKLNGKINLRFVKALAIENKQKLAKNSLLNKVEILENHPLKSWLEQTLRHEFNYACVSGHLRIMENAQSVNDRGLLRQQQQISRDDLPRLQPILGWDNRATVLQKQQEMKAVRAEMDEFSATIKTNLDRRNRLSKERDWWTRISNYEQFTEVDWKSADKQIQQFELEKEKLLNSSNQLQELENQLQQVKNQFRDAEDRRDKLSEQRGKLQSRLDNYERDLAEANDLLKGTETNVSSGYRKMLEERFADEKLMISTIAKIENRLSREISAEKEEQSRARGRAERKLTLSMQQFITPAPEVMEKYPSWTVDTINLHPDFKYLSEFENLYNKIRREDLPKYETRFKDWLNERLIFDIANFKTSLENKEVQILESIEQINDSLRDIDFNSKPLTYIQLDIHKSRDVSIREFKEMLRDAMPDPAALIQGDGAALEVSFQRIRKIIDQLSDNESWRRKVTDVRNWLEFAAIERYRDGDEQRQYYVDSQSLSGGEKAKLAYTILASAIAYQFGIRNRNADKKSFRFAVVDEAFSKVDPENAVYAMELFKHLNLQLMVITPLDKINLAEPYIRAVHFVQNKAKKESQVFDLPMEVYAEKKLAFRE